MNGRTCSTCRYDGCCVDLHYCGGLRWKSAYEECAQCGCDIHVDDIDLSDEDGHCWCSEECMEKWEAENAEDEESEEG